MLEEAWEASILPLYDARSTALDCTQSCNAEDATCYAAVPLLLRIMIIVLSNIQIGFALQVLVSIGVLSTHHGQEYFCFENICMVRGKNVLGQHNEVRQLSRRQ